MITIEREPVVAVGLISGVEAISLELHGDFVSDQGGNLSAGNWRTTADAGQVVLTDDAGQSRHAGDEVMLRPVNADDSFTIRDIVIGIDFHWERKEDQRFRGALRLKTDSQGKLIVINDVPVESYLASVISSEMSAAAHAELLRAHAIISRSWLLAQIRPWKIERGQSSLRPLIRENADGSRELIRWYDREAHTQFDVCADDHCQRYQGITKAMKTAEGAAGLEKVRSVISTTFGQVLIYADAICDARFSKSCGGIVEAFRAAWEDVEIPYLTPLYDGEQFPAEYSLPLSDEANAQRWIVNSPPAFCNTSDRTILQRILPDFDQETTDFYRWSVTLRQDDLQALLQKKLSIDFGPIRGLEPVERGASGRIVRLKISGEKETMIIGKELEIRRALSPSHLYSSAFVIQPEGNSSGLPESFTLTGAGWGHGVGLCQIGAALMAERSYGFERILSHYYPGAELHELYPRPADALD
ncbi:MAG TPA: SpoIID/LytB domain-containing protein [Blastocatellia bacterium]|nr:SpoIID/LytB domain-containing protein [Blastocatellia bacterium]